MLKRFFDVFFSVVALIVFAVPMIVIALILKFKDKHSVIFIQQRVGLNRKTFNVFKFQTMIDEVPTPIGRVLRHTGLDELPQFINVLKGEMSIVGPRALTSRDIKRLGWDSDYYNSRWEIKPGITGLAQIYGGQHKKTSWFWDQKYADISNVFIDFVLVAISFLMNIFGKIAIRRLIWNEKQLR